MNNARWGKTLSFIFKSGIGFWRRRVYDRRVLRVDDLDPLRAELFSADQMEEFGKTLASVHSLSKVRIHDRLLSRLDDNEQVLLSGCALLTDAIKNRSRIAPAGEWLLDNFYMIEEQIRTAKRHLPKNYSRELPRLGAGQSAGLPRVYDLALAAISHGDGRIDAETLSRFVAAYQTVTPLTLGELWAIPIMLRLALIENLRRVSLRITNARAYLNQAREWASQMVEVAESDPKNLIIVIADMARSNPPMVSAFIAELVRRLQGHGPALALPLTWIEQRLAEESMTIEQMVQAENQQQAVDQVSISNSIGSLRFLGAYDWRVFVESMSIVEQILCEDKDDVYRHMDFATRDEYRHVIDRLAKHSHVSEADIARAAIELAQRSDTSDQPFVQAHCYTSHVGYYLVDRGLPQLEHAVAARLPLLTRLRRACTAVRLPLYLGAIFLLIALASAGLFAFAFDAELVVWQCWLLGLLAVFATAPLATALVNWVVTLVVSPKRLPRLDFVQGIPMELATLVVVPTLLTSQQNIDDLLESLEVRFLGNRDEHVYFGLLTDFGDAATETLPGDDALLTRARRGIEQLNQRYNTHNTDRFFLFHRPRLWNPNANCWMGYERKRGKLADLNRLLCDGAGESSSASFSLIVGNIRALPQLRYVITLDSDTQLPRDAARQFVGTMAHPLNRPVYDPERHIITRGYGILQPRMAASLSAANRSRYVQLYGGEPGIDPYTRTVSDVYQDLFGEGSFIGKGIYDLAAFEQVLGGRFPDNRILSHDLLEGCYARAGLLSDVHLYEDSPSRYDVDVSRRERWIRGDWQIAAWLWPRVPGAGGQKLTNPLPALSRWKIADNLLRSLAPLALLLLFLGGWILLPAPALWTLALLGIMLFPPLLATLFDVLRKPAEVFVGQHVVAVSETAGRHLLQALFRLGCLPHEACFSTSAILRSLWRLWFAPGRLLEWCASAEQEHKASGGVLASLRLLLCAPLLAIVIAVGLVVLNPAALLVAAPILCLWLLAPLGVWWLGRPLVRKEPSLSLQQTLFLRKIARKTWSFFERFVVAEDNWLPPDNFQENPGPVIAHRTSPTNMGLALLGNLSAYDFGFITADVLLERTANTFGSMNKLERYRGHFFNWYDTTNLQPLPPRYISAVDSGNLAGHLLTLRAGLVVLPEQRIPASRVFDGLADTLAILNDSLQAAHLQDDLPNVIQAAIIRLRSLLNNTYSSARTVNLPSLLHCLEAVVGAAVSINAYLTAQPKTRLSVSGALLSDTLLNDRHGTPLSDNSSPADEARRWGEALAQQSRSALDELLYFAPWLALRTAPPALNGFMASLPRRVPGTDLNAIPNLHRLAGYRLDLVPLLDAQLLHPATPLEREWLLELRALINSASERASERIATCMQLVEQANVLAAMDYDFLYDRTRHLIAVGYNLDDYRCDNSFYDLLASEARLCNFVAIAQGQVPQESWFALGRLRTITEGEPVLVSWSGSMFEYLMPMLVMPSYDGTLLDQTCRAAVARQIAYGKQRALPWGVSESGYHTFDASLNYQYHAFGVPGLGFKRGLAEDIVISPYASVLALMVAPEAACENLERLAGAGVEGRFGFYEAVDYTPSRLARGQTSALVCSFMVHHQGMSLLALAHLLLDRPMQRRFAADPLFQATLLLLQERIPKSSVLHTHVAEHAEGAAVFDAVETTAYAPLEADTLTPEVQLLSNGRYHVMVTNAGGGYSRWRDMAVTRWREDATRDNWGMFVYLRDTATSEFWSASHQPTLKRADNYEAMFSEGRAEFRRRDQDIETYTELVVSPEDDIELRRLRITNRSARTRTLEITSYAEVVLALPAADATQTAFGNLFVQTEILPERRALLCTRRPRSVGEHTLWMFHLLAVNGNATHGSAIDHVSYETDRLRFTGRGRTLMAPQAVTDGGELSGSQGSVLDPIVAIRCQITLAPGQGVVLDFVNGSAENRDACLALVSRYQDRHLADRVFDLAATHSGVTLRQINASEADAQLYRRLASAVLYAHAALRAEASLLIQNWRGQSGLWGYAISGDLPIVLLKIASSEHIELARQLIQCHAYWRLKGLSVDLVIWNEDHIGYRQRLQDQIMGLITTGSESHAIDRPGGIFVRSGEQISHEDRILLQSVARAIIDGANGSLAEQVKWRGLAEKKVARLMPTRKRTPEADQPQQIAPRADLILTNPLGGFTPDGREYIITTTHAQMTPLPWVNVIANPNFGSVISEGGLAYTWSENAHEYRLTPWCDDPVGSSGGEAIYLRDEETGHFWSPTPQPKRGLAPYVTRHGFGYSVFEHTEDGIRSELWVYVDLEESVKFSVLKVSNESGRNRRLSATGYVEWVLGDLRTKSALHLVTEIDANSGALFARNAYNSEFGGRVCFLDVDDNARTLTGDRTEFLGRNGSLGNPDALTRVRLSGRLGAGLDPCGAIQVPFELGEGQSREIIFRLGAGQDLEQARALALRQRNMGSARAALARVHDYWTRTLGAVQVKTPDPAFNVLANGWLLYQTLACRLWARSGYYQSGGAYGYRDQLQDTMALVHTQPGMMRTQILRAAQRQYPEGDVQHWWHPPQGRGVRTRCSDDYLWLPLVTCHYVQSTGDTGVLDEQLHYLSGRLLNDEEESYYDLPGQGSGTSSLYHHCQRAIEHGLRFGARGLPLMGSGDWNDGMNLVGIHGKGESVWLGFMLYKVLLAFSNIAHQQQDSAFAERCRDEAKKLQDNIDQHAWDGAWFRRAWFDDGVALGSAVNDECRIDSIAQSWSVLSGAGDPMRARQAMASLDTHLVRRDKGIIQLLDPPFDQSAMNPGYIKGYVPGVRENGGQYTHAAIWATMAFAELRDSQRAWELFNIINPVNHGNSAAAVALYKAEPYVVAADVYAIAPHTGRGGWSWYTGSAGWLYRLMIESLLGITRQGNELHIKPCLPVTWSGYSVGYRFGNTLHRIEVIQTAGGENKIILDGIELQGAGIPLADDGRERRVEVRVMALVTKE